MPVDASSLVLAEGYATATAKNHFWGANLPLLRQRLSRVRCEERGSLVRLALTAVSEQRWQLELCIAQPCFKNFRKEFP